MRKIVDAVNEMLGRETERDAIVAWLRKEVGRHQERGRYSHASGVLSCAHAISRGDHLRQETK